MKGLNFKSEPLWKKIKIEVKFILLFGRYRNILIPRNFPVILIM